MGQLEKLWRRGNSSSTCCSLFDPSCSSSSLPPCSSSSFSSSSFSSSSSSSSCSSSSSSSSSLHQHSLHTQSVSSLCVPRTPTPPASSRTPPFKSSRDYRGRPPIASKSAVPSVCASHAQTTLSSDGVKDKSGVSSRNSHEKTSRRVASAPGGKGEAQESSLGVRTPPKREDDARQYSARHLKEKREEERLRGDGDELLLNRKFIGDQGCKGVTASLMKKTNFVRIDLSANNITSQGLAALLPGFAVQHVLKHLDLNWNSLASPGSIADSSGAGSTSSSRCMYTLQSFCDWVSTHGRLHTLTLAHCRLGNEGAACMTDVMTRNTSLLTVDLSHNGMGAAACALLVQAIEASNQTVLHVDLGGNGASYSSVDALERACARNRVNRHVVCLQRTGAELHAQREEQLKLQQLQKYVLQLEKEVTIRQEEFGKIVEGMHADAAEASRRLAEAREEIRELKENLRSANFALVAEKKKALDTSNLKKEIQALQLVVSSREKEGAELRSQVNQLETETHLQAEELQRLRAKNQEVADASLLTQQSLDDANVANKQLEAFLHQRESRIEGLAQEVQQLRRELAAAESATDQQSKSLLAQCQATQDENRKLEEKIYKLERERQQLEQQKTHLAWSLEKEERERDKRRLQEEEKRKEERQMLQEQAEEWKNKLELQMKKQETQEQAWQEERKTLLQQLRDCQQAACAAEAEASALKFRQLQREVEAHALESELRQLKEVIAAKEEQHSRQQHEREAFLLSQRRKEEEWRAAVATSEAAAADARMHAEAATQEAKHLEEAIRQRELLTGTLQDQLQQSKGELAKTREERQKLERERAALARELKETREKGKKLEESFQTKCKEAFEALRLSLSAATSDFSSKGAEE
ncbi:putative myosin heavy chain [Neospora caninum Liverpool]|uniref:Myosin heavy chain, putative n=1 Tax=Neospora caninum (strain Liverpool) TaxID=572307 RepID=F0V883_NEOCL|nr:putative myosin heavy chain [Neospora caninum Liverpool]CBZ49924.1 putative myosin heavy chain [Neospora caninum Liverpool]CEL64511.1 TPA: myosin heavy chain, putative [Neospora caninum Liverpool]|eukprot:XP_003879959.1 putative myosin heavy chain [Neospora caninum Liverpool]